MGGIGNAYRRFMRGGRTICGLSATGSAAGFEKAPVGGLKMMGPGLQAFVTAAALGRATAPAGPPRPRLVYQTERPRRLNGGPGLLGWRPISPPQK